MESVSVIQYKWKVGVYDLKDMIKMVKDGIIDKDEFFDITRYNFNGVTEDQQY